MIPEYFALIGSFTASLGVYYYAWRTFCGLVQPNRLTWFFWTAFPCITFLALISSDAGIVAWVAFFGLIPSALVLLVSYVNPQAYWKIRPIDYMLAGLASAGIALWWVSGDPLFGVLFSILADFAISATVIMKAWSSPRSESIVAYGINVLGFMLAVFAIQTWSEASALYLVYLVCMNAVFVFILSTRRFQIER